MSRTISANEYCFSLTTNQRTVLSIMAFQSDTTGGALFTEGPGHSVKAQKPSAKALPSAVLDKEPSEKKLTAKRLFAEGHLSGTRQILFRVPTAALGKEKQPSTALLR